MEVSKTIGRRRRPNFFFIFLLPLPKAPLSRRAREIPQKAGVLRVLNKLLFANHFVPVFNSLGVLVCVRNLVIGHPVELDRLAELSSF